MKWLAIAFGEQPFLGVSQAPTGRDQLLDSRRIVAAYLVQRPRRDSRPSQGLGLIGGVAVALTAAPPNCIVASGCEHGEGWSTSAPRVSLFAAICGTSEVPAPTGPLTNPTNGWVRPASARTARTARERDDTGPMAIPSRPPAAMRSRSQSDGRSNRRSGLTPPAPGAAARWLAVRAGRRVAARRSHPLRHRGSPGPGRGCLPSLAPRPGAAVPDDR
jgi:hypothetical protein